MHMRINTPWHDVATGRIQLSVTFEITAYFDDYAIVYQDICAIAEICCNDGTVSNDCTHYEFLSDFRTSRLSLS